MLLLDMRKERGITEIGLAQNDERLKFWIQECHLAISKMTEIKGGETSCHGDVTPQDGAQGGSAESSPPGHSAGG